eukprot:m.932075 g.932075  ORF g.932075 m.932075 type:complete len:1699 (+) comp23786_c0_seq2:1789-6885(+)
MAHPNHGPSLTGAAFGMHFTTHRSTVADYCLESRFISADHPNLVVVSSNILRVYDTVSGRLELLASFELHGAIQSIQSTRLSGRTHDSLFLTFLDAKLSIVEFDHARRDLRTVSMHAFEDNEMRDGLVQREGFPEVKIDPDGRCAVMLVQRRKLVVIPLAKEETNVSKSTNPTPSGDSAKITEHKSRFRSYVIDCHECSKPLKRIHDFALLDGFYEPTIVLLHEPVVTWVGRYAVTRDTKAIAALSLNLSDQRNTLIWSVDRLPSDAQHVVAVPRPLGGILLVGVNFLMHLNQATPPFGVALNSHATCAAIALRALDGPVLTLDRARHTLLDDTGTRILFALHGGELHLLTIVSDGRSVERFQFERLASSVLAQCICRVGADGVFLGSRLGDSLLLHVEEQDVDTPQRTATGNTDGGVGNIDNDIGNSDEGVDDEGRPSKRRNVESTDAADDDTEAFDDDLNIYGDDDGGVDGHRLTTCKLRIADSLTNPGPMAAFAPAGIDGLPAGAPESVRLVCASGYGKNGGLTLLQRSVRPHTVMLTDQLSKAHDLWAIRSNTEAGEDTVASSVTRQHNYLVLSQDTGTIVLQTDGDLHEVTESGFNMGSPTVLVANILDDALVVQVTPFEVRLLRGTLPLQQVPVSGRATVVGAAVAGKYLLLHLSDGRATVLKAKRGAARLETGDDQDEESGDATDVRLVVIGRIGRKRHDPIVACAIYADHSGVFSADDDAAAADTASHDPNHGHATTAEVVPATEGDANTETDAKDWEGVNEDDIDEMLYGDEDDDAATDAAKPVEEATEAPAGDGDTRAGEAGGGATRRRAPVWCIVARKSGSLAIHALPDLRECFAFKTFMMIPRLVVDVGHDDGAAPGSSGVDAAGVAAGGTTGPAGATLARSAAQPGRASMAGTAPQQDGTDATGGGSDGEATAMTFDDDDDNDDDNTATASSSGTDGKRGVAVRPGPGGSTARGRTGARGGAADGGGAVTVDTDDDDEEEEEDDDDAGDDDDAAGETAAPADTGDDAGATGGAHKVRLQSIHRDNPTVREVLVAGLGADGSRPHLFASLDSGHVAVYEIFRFVASGEKFQQRLKIRLKKTELGTFTREPDAFLKARFRVGAHEDARRRQQHKLGRKSHVVPFFRKCLRRFTNVNGLSGVFVCSSRPQWFVMGRLKALQRHPMWGWGGVGAWTEFNSSHCNVGFVCLSDVGDPAASRSTTEADGPATGTHLRIAMLEPHLDYDADLLTYKIPLKRTVSHVAHHPETGVYVVGSHKKIPFLYAPIFNNEDIPSNPDPISVPPRFVRATETRHAITLVSPDGWQTVPKTEIALEQYEVISAMSVVQLKSEEHISGLRSYIAVGVSCVASEEVSSRGRVLILDVLDVVPEPGQPLTKNKLKVLASNSEKGCVTAVSSVSGYLIIATGQIDGGKMYVYNFENKETLTGIAYAEAQTYVTSVSTLRNTLFIGDMSAGVTLFHFTEDHIQIGGEKRLSGTLVRVSKEVAKRSVTATQFFIHDDHYSGENHLGFVACDSTGNLVVYSYLLDDPDTFGGRILLRRADFHLGCSPTAMYRLRCSTGAVAAQYRGLLGAAVGVSRHLVAYGSKEATCGMLLPVTENRYRRLQMLQTKLTTGLPQRAGLNPKQYRMHAFPMPDGRNQAKRNILDGGLLQQFVSLGVIEQREFAKRIGTTVEQILDDLCDAEYASAAL